MVHNLLQESLLFINDVFNLFPYWHPWICHLMQLLCFTTRRQRFCASTVCFYHCYVGDQGTFYLGSSSRKCIKKTPFMKGNIPQCYWWDYLAIFVPVVQQTLISVQWKSFSADALYSHESCSLSVMFIMVWMSLVLKCWRFSASHILEQSHLVFRGDVQHFF